MQNIYNVSQDVVKAMAGTVNVYVGEIVEEAYLARGRLGEDGQSMNLPGSSNKRIKSSIVNVEVFHDIGQTRFLNPSVFVHLHTLSPSLTH